MKLPAIPLLFVSLGLALAACTLGPNFETPRPGTPQNWTQSALSPPTDRKTAFTTSLAEEGAWWAGFQDPALSSLIARAASANLDLQQAALRIAEARTQLTIAEADQWPTLGGNASYARERFSQKTAQGSLFNSIGSVGAGTGLAIPRLPNPYDQFQAGFDASWEPDLFGRVRRSVEAATADMEATAEDRNSALVSLQGEVARSYIDLRGTQMKLAIVRDNFATQQEVLTLARQRRQAGLGTDIDVSNASAQVTSTQSQVPLLEREISTDINQLSQLLAREPGALRGELVAVKPAPSAPSQIALGLPGELVRRRPDIRAAEARLHAATARVGVATADLFPRLTFNASFGTQAERFPDLADWASRFLNIGPSIDIPIFEGGRLRATVHLQDLQEKEAAVEYAKTVLAAVHEVENALVSYNAQQERRRSLDATVAENRNTLALARQRYQSGVTTFLDVLDAERTLQQNELSLADSSTTALVDLIAVYKALGGGWQEISAK